MPEWISTDEHKAKAAEFRDQLRPLASVTAAAARLTTPNGTTARRTQRPAATSQQEEAWDMVALVGELHFLVNRLANQIGQGTLYVGEIDPATSPTDEPVETTNPTAQAVLAAFGRNQAGRSQIMRRMAANIIVAGEGWILGIDEDRIAGGGVLPETPMRLPATLDTKPLTELEWRALSISEVTSPRLAGEVTIRLEDGSQIETSVDDVELTRCWRPHDRRAWEADSALMSALPVLRELVGLGMHSAAQIDSRLAGAGLSLVKDSVIKSARIGAGLAPEAIENPLMDALIESMMTPIQDRGTPAAVVPLIVPVPDDLENPWTNLGFSTPLDAEASARVDRLIRRLANSMDCPPELLLGTGGMNHWGAWLVNEDTVTIHIEPPLALICDALTTQYLWPALIQKGMAEEQAQRFVVWYSVDHMIVRPNSFDEARQLWEAGLIDDDTYRRTGGFDTSDSPEANDEGPGIGAMSEADAKPAAIAMAMDMLKTDPSLASTPGPVKLANDLLRLLTGDLDQPEPPAIPPPGQPAEEEEPPAGVLPTGPTTDGPPDAEGPPG